MNKRRLLKLADLLERDARRKRGIQFNLNTWAAPSGAKLNFAGSEPSLDCNTNACAMGLACLSGAFKRAGLSFFVRKSPGLKSFLIPTMPDPEWGTCGGFGAAAVLFKIGIDEAEFLFDPVEYPRKFWKGAIGERVVAKRIRKFVSDGGIKRVND